MRMVQFSLGIFVGAILAIFILALMDAGDDEHDRRG